METRQLDASPAATVRRRHRPLPQAAGTVTGTPNTPDADRTAAARTAAAPPPRPLPRAGKERSPGGRTPARPSRVVAALGARLARASRLVPPVIAPIASRGPSHATSGGS
jgi:hypothetical protein